MPERESDGCPFLQRVWGRPLGWLCPVRLVQPARKPVLQRVRRSHRPPGRERGRDEGREEGRRRGAVCIGHDSGSGSQQNLNRAGFPRGSIPCLLRADQVIQQQAFCLCPNCAQLRPIPDHSSALQRTRPSSASCSTSNSYAHLHVPVNRTENPRAHSSALLITPAHSSTLQDRQFAR